MRLDQSFSVIKPSKHEIKLQLGRDKKKKKESPMQDFIIPIFKY